MSSNKEDKVFKDLMALMDMITGSPVEGNDPINASFDLQDIEKWSTAMSVYINGTITDDKRREVIHHLLKATSPSRTTRIISVVSFSELFHHAELLEKSPMVDLLRILAEKIHSTDDVEAYFVIKALGNATKGDPREVEILKDFIIDNFLRRFRDCVQLDISIQILQAMSKYVRPLNWSKLGSMFDRIFYCCPANICPHPLIEADFVELFADLARSYDKKMCGGFKGYVKAFLPGLLIMLHCKDPQRKASAVAALLYSLPHIAFQNAAQLLTDDRKNIYKLYEQLGQEDPAFLAKMLVESIYSLSCEPDLNAVLKHLSKIKDALPYEELYGTAMRNAWVCLKRLTHASEPLREKAGNLAMEICNTKWNREKGYPHKPQMPQPKYTAANLGDVIIKDPTLFEENLN